MNVVFAGSSSSKPVSDTLYYGSTQKSSKSTPFLNSESIINISGSEKYSSTSISFEYTSKDGDTVSFSMKSVQYSKFILEVAANGDREDMKKLVDHIKDSLDKMGKSILKSFLKGNDENISGIGKIDAPESLKIPEYWNAENTSQRIIDFAVSFYGTFKGTGEEFLSTIKNAIDEGFKQAREMMGELPEEISSLADETSNLVMKKLTSWAQGHNISVPRTETVPVYV